MADLLYSRPPDYAVTKLVPKMAQAQVREPLVYNGLNYKDLYGNATDLYKN